MRRMRTLIVALAVLGLMALSAVPVLAVEVGPAEVSFAGYQYNYPASGYSTWYYTVTSNEDPAVSHLVIELGECCIVTDAGTWGPTLPPVDPLVSLWNTGDIEVVDDPTTGVFGIKFDILIEPGETVNYYFTVEGNHAVDPRGITVAVKSGTGPSSQQVQMSVAALAQQAFQTWEVEIPGPDLDCTTAITLKSFSAGGLDTSGPPTMWLFGALLAALVVMPTTLVLSTRLLLRRV